MSTVFFDVGLSLDGYLAGPNGSPRNPLGDGGIAIHQWLFGCASFLERVGMPGGERSADDDQVRAVFERAGAYVMGRRMFDEGEVAWPEHAPFRAPVFVLTRHAREPWVRLGGTTFYFVTDGLHAALDRARDAAGSRDVRISGGADTIRQYLAAGLIDEFTLHTAPLLLGHGLRLFDELTSTSLAAEPIATSHTHQVAHLRFRVRRPAMDS